MNETECPTGTAKQFKELMEDAKAKGIPSAEYLRNMRDNAPLIPEGDVYISSDLKDENEKLKSEIQKLNIRIAELEVYEDFYYRVFNGDRQISINVGEPKE